MAKKAHEQEDFEDRAGEPPAAATESMFAQPEGPAPATPPGGPSGSPRRVPLTKQEEGPPKGTPASRHGKLPRVVHENERAPEGTTRFRVRAKVPGEHVDSHYILAAKDDQESAEIHYLEHTKLQRSRKVYNERENRIDTVLLPHELVVEKLPD